MKKYKNILIACDSNTKDDSEIFECVNSLKQDEQAKVSMVHVLQTPYMFEGAYEFEYEFENADRLCELADKMNIPKERVFIKNGDVGQKILNVADSINADLIILGNHGRHGLNAFFFGNTGSKLMERVGCDVLAHKIA